MSADTDANQPALAPAERAAEVALGSALTLIAVAWALDVPQRLQWALFTEQFLAAVLALVLPLAFLATSQRRKRTGAAGPVDIFLAVLGALAAGYVAVAYPELQARLVYRPWDGVAIGAVLLLLVLEAVRRACGPALLIIVLAFIAYALLGHLLPGQFASRPVNWDRLTVYLAMDTNALIGTPLLVAAEVVIPFILMGQILARGGGAEFFNDIALAAAGRSRGGGGKIAVLSSLLFGFVSGSAVANVVSGGIITIPLMVKSGMRPDRAAAVEAVSSTGGQLVPPVMGAAAFLMAEFLGIPYRDVALAAIAPSILFYLALYVWCDFAAGRERLALVDAADIPRAGPVLKSGWHYALPFAALFVALFWWNWSAQLAALFGCAILYVTCTIFGYRGKRMKLRDIGWTIASTGAGVLEVIVICAGAGLVIGVLNLTGLAFGLTLYLGRLAEADVFVLLLVTAGIAIVLGMGMPTVAVYVLVASLIAPSMIKAGIDPLAAHMFLLYFGMLSMITPPVALASFAAASIARADFWRTGWEGVKIGWIAYVIPFVFVFQPSILFRGNLWIGLWELATSCFGVVLGTAALVGYAKGPLAWLWRLVALVAAVLLFLPVDALPKDTSLGLYAAAAEAWLRHTTGIHAPAGVALNLIGIALGVAVFATDAGRVRRVRAARA